jgi:uncharacterized membrane protein YjgN (DUF898 family)
MWTCSFRLSGLESRVERQRKKAQRHALHPLYLIATAAAHLGFLLVVGTLVAVIYLVLPSQQVRITSVTASEGQSPNSVTHGQSVLVIGQVTNPRISQIFLDVNGALRPVSVENGTFQSRVGLFPGRNRIQASLDRHGLGMIGASQAIRIAAKIPSSDIWSELTWEGLGDIDLHLLQPDGEECWYSNRITRTGATLDYDNTEKDGPEHITLPNAAPGTYRVTVVYFAARVAPPRKVPWMVTLSLRNDAFRRTYSGVLEYAGEAETVAEFNLR